MKTYSIMFQIVLIIFLFSISNVALSGAITVSDKKEIQLASALSNAISTISQKVMKCIDKNNGKTESCVCKTYETCKFKSEYKNVMSRYCDAITAFPDWKGKTINYKLPSDTMSHALGMPGLEKQFGHNCK